MGRLRAWGAALRRSPWRGLAVVGVVGALAAGAVLLATRPGTAPPPPSVRAVAFGDSVPYGHGLANPYLTPQIGLPSGDVGNYYLTAVVWTSSSFKSESMPSPVTVTGGGPTDAAVTID